MSEKHFVIFAKVAEVLQLLLVLFAVCSLYLNNFITVNFTLIFSAVMFLMAIEAVLKGEVNLRAKVVTKQKNQVLFFTFVAIYLLAAALTFCFALQ